MLKIGFLARRAMFLCKSQHKGLQVIPKIPIQARFGEGLCTLWLKFKRARMKIQACTNYILSVLEPPTRARSKFRQSVHKMSIVHARMKLRVNTHDSECTHSEFRVLTLGTRSARTQNEGC